MNSSVLIVGAGPTGLALALWLTELGVKIRIIDKAAEPGTTTRAVVMHARTLEFYRQAGVVDAMVQGGHQVAGVNLWARGARAMRLPFGRIGEGLSAFPYVLDFPQDLHERLLLGRLDSLGVRVERSTELKRLSQQDDGVRAVLKRADGSEVIFNATYLAGCDGASSTVRDQLGIGFAGGTYEDLFYVADVEASGPAVDDDIHIDLDDGEFVGIFPYKESGRVRLIGTVQPKASRDQAAITFADVRGRAIEHMRLTIERVHWFSTYHNHHRVADHFRAGRAFLLGDAAHIHSPVGGQGLNTGIGDAVNLAWKMAAALRGNTWDGLLDSYEAERINFARRLVATTDRAFTLITKRGGFAQWVRTGLAPLILTGIFRLRSVRRYAFRTVSQIGIQYRGSPLSAGTAGGVHGGDRLPWIDSPDGDNFEPLRSQTWQAHVYGEPRSGLAETCASLGVPLHVFGWFPRLDDIRLARDALYLLRPDGYVALADPHAEPERLRRYFDERGGTGRGLTVARRSS